MSQLEDIVSKALRSIEERLSAIETKTTSNTSSTNATIPTVGYTGNFAGVDEYLVKDSLDIVMYIYKKYTAEDMKQYPEEFRVAWEVGRNIARKGK